MAGDRSDSTGGRSAGGRAIHAATVLTVIIAALVAATPWLLQWQKKRTARQMASGTVSTSQPGELWKATMDMIGRLQAENEGQNQQIDKLVGQRDRLIGVLDEGVLPTLERNSGMITTILALLREGARDGHTAPIPPP